MYFINYEIISKSIKKFYYLIISNSKFFKLNYFMPNLLYYLKYKENQEFISYIKKVFKNRNIDMNLVNEDILYFAMYIGDLNFIKKILSEIKNIKKIHLYKSFKLIGIYNHYHLINYFFECYEHNEIFFNICLSTNYDFIIYLLEKFPNIKYKSDEILINTSKTSNLNFFKLFLINLNKKEKYEIYFNSLINNNLEIHNYISKNWKEINYNNLLDEEKFKIIKINCKLGKLNNLKFLLNNYDENIINKYKNNIIYYALNNNDENLLKWIKKFFNQNELNNFKLEYNYIKKGLYYTLLFLIENCNFTDLKRKIIYQILCQYNYTKCIKLFINKINFDLNDEISIIFFNYAFKYENIDLLKYYFENNNYINENNKELLYKFINKKNKINFIIWLLNNNIVQSECETRDSKSQVVNKEELKNNLNNFNYELLLLKINQNNYKSARK